jgi:Lecithin retinol acyltransferase
MAIGDHVFVYAWGYSHHGIDCGDGTVIHFDGDPWRVLTSSCSGAVPTVSRVPWDTFAAGRPVYICHHDTSFVADMVVERAVSRLGESGYDLVRNNCEHFAVWCKTGLRYSSQSEAAVEAIDRGMEKLPWAVALARASRFLPGHVRLGVYGIALGATVGRAAGQYLVRRLEHIQRGHS